MIFRSLITRQIKSVRGKQKKDLREMHYLFYPLFFVKKRYEQKI